ncbi:hypothetical protein SAMN05444007_102157 [Cribrihabitans marinus]|uniref:Uncharacterized protein n=1 Tax=Cribrihabitans marinus TaxID=1227549 RepID=A0A1H6SPW5_9RHOB|nr:hypothetical protein [Cribrihabitans marinus]GGH23021.1 hypothetical protein GCM10010973_08680 [Cribrihabitans marinus]SEI69881.1 hypothetical protein SAMN05444007_102157 [Cribrihabitans marinus]
MLTLFIAAVATLSIVLYGQARIAAREIRRNRARAGGRVLRDLTIAPRR